MTCADSPAPRYTVDLDAPARGRWKTTALDILNNHGWDNSWGQVFSYLNNIIPLKDWKELDPILKPILYETYPKEITEEIKGLWEVVVENGYSANATEGQLAFMQLYYEIDNFCTSIVAQNPNGTIFHARNLDYSLPGLENITADITWVKGGKPVFYSTQYIGYMGVLTGMRPGGWSVSVNQRFSIEVPEVSDPKGGVPHPHPHTTPHSTLESLTSARRLLCEVNTIISYLDGAASIGLLLRDTLLNVGSYADMLPVLEKTEVQWNSGGD